MTQVYGDPEAAYEVAVRSYLDSAYFEEAARMISEVRGRLPGSTALDRLGHYAEGMQAFLAGSYAKSLERLSHWLDTGPGRPEAHYAQYARAAVSRIPSLSEPEERAQMEPLCRQLEGQIDALFADDTA